MATLTNPINAQNIVDRFADYVVATANAGIVWGVGANPVADTGPVASGVTDQYITIVGDADFGGDTNGKAIQISGFGFGGNPIDGSNIYDTLIAETNRYTKIRKLRAVYDVTGSGGNAGTRLTNTGQDLGRDHINVFDSTNVAYMSDAYLQSISIGSDTAYGIKKDVAISAGNLETFFDALRSAYNTARDNVVTISGSTCHASCHTSCHSSRGRR